jgi:hypothetical protein
MKGPLPEVETTTTTGELRGEALRAMRGVLDGTVSAGEAEATARRLKKANTALRAQAAEMARAIKRK